VTNISSADKTKLRLWLPRQRSLRDRKPNFRLITYGHSSTIAKNLAKIGPVDFETTGLRVPSVLFCLQCFDGRKGIRPVKKLSGGVLAWLSVWSEVQTCIWPSGCQCHSLSLASVKSRLVLPFWYRLTWVVPKKWPLNGCVCVCVRACVRVCVCVCGLTAIVKNNF